MTSALLIVLAILAVSLWHNCKQRARAEMLLILLILRRDGEQPGALLRDETGIHISRLIYLLTRMEQKQLVKSTPNYLDAYPSGAPRPYYSAVPQ